MLLIMRWLTKNTKIKMRMILLINISQFHQIFDILLIEAVGICLIENFARFIRERTKLKEKDLKEKERRP